MIFIRKILNLLILFVLFFSFPYVSIAAEEEAVFAGGCFWCLEHDLESLPGVKNVESGYSGGISLDPTYENHKGHQESVRVIFDNKQISYSDLLRSYWRNIDPLDQEGQFCDRGDSYKPVIFTQSKSQEETSNLSIEKVSKEIDKPIEKIKVIIKPFEKFWIAESYHQNFAEINSLTYKFYRYRCGRDQRLEKVWGKNARSQNDW
tara:strand:+ start:1259 stop:1873 length:615 start_codon:yes stop_codon:yes gene_type:complete